MIRTTPPGWVAVADSKTTLTVRVSHWHTAGIIVGSLSFCLSFGLLLFHGSADDAQMQWELIASFLVMGVALPFGILWLHMKRRARPITVDHFSEHILLADRPIADFRDIVSFFVVKHQSNSRSVSFSLHLLLVNRREYITLIGDGDAHLLTLMGTAINSACKKRVQLIAKKEFDRLKRVSCSATYADHHLPK